MCSSDLEILQFLKVFRELQREDFDTGCLPPPCLKSKSFIDFYKSKAVRKIMASATYQPIFMRWLAKVEGYRSGWWMHGAGPKCGFDGKEIKFSRRIKNIDHIAREFLRKTPRQFFEKYYELLLDEYDEIGRAHV